MRNRFGARWDCPLGRLIRRGYMFLIFIPAALLFRAESVGQIGLIFTRLFTAWGSGYVAEAFAALGLETMTLFQLALSIACMARIYRLTRCDLVTTREETAVSQRTAAYAYLILTILLCALALLATQEATDFAYFQF